MKTLRDLDINWKKTGAYNLKCRWVAPNQSSNYKASANHDSPMAGSVPRVSSRHWSAEQHGVPGSVTPGNKDNESGVESNVLKFELQVCILTPEGTSAPGVKKRVIVYFNLVGLPHVWIKGDYIF